MRLWIDGQCFQSPSRFRGIGRYSLELIRAIREHAPDIEVLISFNAGIADEALAGRSTVDGLFEPQNIHVWQGAARNGERHGGLTPARRMSELALTHHVNCLAPDVALAMSSFEGTEDASAPLFKGPASLVPVVSIFYDAIPLRFPAAYLQGKQALRTYRRRLQLCAASDAVLCISEFSRAEMVRLVPGAKAFNISAAASRGFDGPLEPAAGERRSGYILYVGGLDWRKNVPVLVEAFAGLPEDLRRRRPLLLAGEHPPTLLKELTEFARSLGVSPDTIESVGHVSDERLIDLYRGAAVLVQPSLMEGFGLTALEAMTSGVPVVAANAGALAEVIGRNDLLFDPTSPAQLTAMLQRVLGDPVFAEEIRAAGLRQAARFSWQRTAAAAVDVLRSVAQTPAADPVQASRAATTARGRIDRRDRELAAHLLALAEPRPPTAPRLIVDMTSTIRIDHKTGIQRVVNKIGSNIAAAAGSLPVVFSYCDDHTGWYGFPAWPVETVAKTAENRLRPGSGDRILMLDSSWEFHAQQDRFLRESRLRGVEITSCLYDLVPLDLPAFCGPGMPQMFSAWFKSALTYSTSIICISRAVAEQLMALLTAIRFPRPLKVGYWRLGSDFTLPAADTDAVEARPKGAASFLMVGTVEPRKGYAVALDAFDALWAEGADVDLVIAGKEGWGVEHIVQRIAAHPERDNRLRWHRGVDDATLAGLYVGADALIAASFAEGFGLPVIEAGRLGKPVIAADIAVFREVAAGTSTASFFTAGSSSALAGAVRSFVRKPAKHRATGAAPEWPNWTQSAAELAEVVLKDRWQFSYQPQARVTVGPRDIGDVVMKKPLAKWDDIADLKLVEGPIVLPNGSVQYQVAVTNRSQELWSSAGAASGALGIALGHHAVTGRVSSPEENPRTLIPFVLGPGQTQYLPVYVAGRWRQRGADQVDIQLVQEGVAWLDRPLRVPL